MKRCSKCKEIKSTDEFGNLPGKLSHLLKSHCKTCNAKYAKEYRRLHTDYFKSWYLDNKEWYLPKRNERRRHHRHLA